MKHFTKSVIFAAVACLITGNCTTFAQNKSRGNGGSRNFGNVRGSFSAGQQSSGNSRGTSSNAGNSISGKVLQSGGFSSNKGGGSVSRPGNTGLPSSGLRTRIGSPSLSTTTSSNRGASNVTLPWRQKSGNGGITTVPFLPKGKGSNGNSNQSASGQQSASVGSQMHWKHNLQHVLAHNEHHWCHNRPATCHWWTQYCQPIAHCHRNDVIICDWNRVQCAVVVDGGMPAPEVQWYLGLKGILLPGKGIGIDAVEPNSPAEQIGLQPGMVITVCNGIALVDESSMQEAIRISGGVLQMTLLSADGSQVLEGVAVMSRVSVVNF